MKARLDKEKAKKVVGKTASSTIKFTVKMVKIIFIIIIIYTVLVTLFLFLTEDKQEILKNIATISAGGFWAFFLGYFGWRLGQSIEMYFMNLKKNK